MPPMLKLVQDIDATTERVARALARHEYRTPKFSDSINVNVWRRGPEDKFIEKRWRDHLDEARVAIAAFRQA